MQDNGGTRSGNDWRTFQYTACIPEKRSGWDRRKGFDRRSSIKTFRSLLTLPFLFYLFRANQVEQII